MAAPQFVPLDPTAEVRSYSSAPRRPDSWWKDRPGEIVGRQPLDDRLGVPGPDPGYALTMAAHYEGRVRLRSGESEADALAGAAAVAMKRAGLRGRAPLLQDVAVGLTVWGFLDLEADEELCSVRRDYFEQVHERAHYPLLRRIADAVPARVLNKEVDEIATVHQADWRACLELEA